MQTQLVAGDSLKFTTSVTGYPATDGWTLKYRLVPMFTTPTQAPIAIEATASGSDYSVSVATTTTAAWAAGRYSWSSWVEKTGERQTLESGTIEVLPDPNTATQGGYDTRSSARIALEAVEAVIAKRATLDQQQYTIGNRQLVRMTVQELILLRDKLRADVAKEENADKISKGMGGGARIVVRS